MEQIKVLHYVAVMDRGGQETFIMNVFRNIDRDKVMFDFLCTLRTEGDYDNEIQHLGGEILRVDQTKIEGNLKRLVNTYFLYRKLKQLRREYAAFHIHSQHAMDAFFSALAAKKAGFKIVIVHSHNTNTDCHKKFHFVFRPLLNMIPIKRFACSRAAGQWMYKNTNFEVINNGINTEIFKFSQEAREHVRGHMRWSEKYVIGHVGRFAKQKNHEFLINVFEKVHVIVPESVLVLCGEGELKSEIERQVAKKGLKDHVEFLGVRTDMALLYQGMDLFCFPSLYEGLPVTLVEAQANDLPCLIAEAITDEVIINENVYRLSVDNNEEKWAKEIEKISKKKFERRNRERIMIEAGYDMEYVAKYLEEFYLEE